MPIEIAGLHYYPVKGLRGIDAEQAQLADTGLAFDRQWMIVMPNGRMVTQRQNPSLARITAQLRNDMLVLAGDAGQVEVPLGLDEYPRERTDVTIWRDQFTALNEGEEVSRWLTETLESSHPLRLVRMCPGVRRPQSNPEQLGAETSTGFADAAPMLLANTESLAALNDRLMENRLSPVGMDRFRPNIVIRGMAAFAEYQPALLVGVNRALTIELCYPSERCIVTTIDQQTGSRNPEMEPLATLREMNTAPGKQGAYFGENARLNHGAGTLLSVGDRLDLEPLPTPK